MTTTFTTVLKGQEGKRKPGGDGMTTTFTTVLKGQEGKPTGIQVPPEHLLALGPKKTPAVVVNVSGYVYRSTVGVMDGAFMIPVSAAHRSAAGLKAGDQIEVTLTLDTEPRTVTVPEDLNTALSTSGRSETFAALAPSKRKEFVRQVEEAKTPETRERRIARIVVQLE